MCIAEDKMSRNSKSKRKIKDNLKGILANSGSLILLVAICTAVIASIMNFQSVISAVGRFINVLMPFIIGILLAFLINPMVENIKRILNRFILKGKRPKMCKYISVALSYVILLGLLTVSFVYIVPQISESLKELTKSLSTGYDYLISHTTEIKNKYPYLPMEDIIEILKKVLPENIFNYGTNFAKFVFPYLYNIFDSFVSGVIDVIFSVVISCYVILDKDKITKYIRRIIYVFTSKKNAPIIWDTFRECNHIFNGFLYGKAIDSLIIGILCLIVMSILRLPYALLLSLIVGVTNMIPYFGPFVGAIPGIIIYLVIEPKLSIIYAIMIFILQQFDGLYLGPKILGDQTGIKPLWVIFGITVGGAYYGVLGMFLGVPTVAVIMHIVNVIIERKIKEQMEREHRKSRKSN